MDNCRIASGLTASFDTMQDMSLRGSWWRATNIIRGALGALVTGNKNLGPTTITSSSGVVAVTGNALVGSFNSASGGGSVSFTGNHQNGNTVTLNASDTSAGNHT